MRYVVAVVAGIVAACALAAHAWREMVRVYEEADWW